MTKEHPMNKKKVTYMAVTGLFILAALPGAIGDLVQPEMVVEIAETLDIPLHLLTLIGGWKVLGVVGLLQPVSERVKEWAYAGFFFDLTGAAWWHAAAGDTGGIAPPLVILGLLGASYALRSAAQAESEASTPAFATAATP